jgi:cell division protein FtsN
MVNYERGVYEPNDEVRVFDGSEDEEDIEGSRLPLLIVLAVLVVAAFVGIVYLAYTQGVARGRGETPVLTAETGPEKVAPQNPGGVKVPYQGFKIYEQPAPPDDRVDNATPSGTPAVTPHAPVPQAAKSAPAALAQKPAIAPSAQKASVASPPAAKPAAPKNAPAAAPNVATGAPRRLGVSPPQPETAARPTPGAVAPSRAAQSAAPPSNIAEAGGGSYVLQIGAYKSQGDADAAWRTYRARHAALLSGFSENVTQADLGSKGIWYRLRVAGFADKDGADALCDRLKADGGTCFLSK